MIVSNTDHWKQQKMETNLCRVLQSVCCIICWIAKGKSHTVSDRRCTAIAHAIISASRPRCFISPLLLGSSMYINCKYASRELIDILSSVSFADDYEEVHIQRFEQALMSGGDLSYDEWFYTICV